MNEADAHILQAVRNGFSGAPPERLGIAVSGGGDSVALLHILSRCFDPGRLAAATVDHGLRPEAAQEAEAVAAQAAALGIAHTTLRWSGWDGAGNLQDQARRARYRLLADWARAAGLEAVALAHTSDDQAETFVMRLSRAAGVDGLAAMQPRRVVLGVPFLRPALGLSRAALRAYLTRNGLSWAEDPSNQDDAFGRIRARRALELLEDTGLTAEALVRVADNMARARDALDQCTTDAALEVAKIRHGAVLLEPAGFAALPEEIARRILLRAIGWVAGAEYPPRRAPLAELLAAMRQGNPGGTLGGCRILRNGAGLWICREYAAVRDVTARPGDIWDNRWRLTGPNGHGCEIRAMGRSGLEQCPDWRDIGLPRPAMLAAPSVWEGDHLVAAPAAGRPEQWCATLAVAEDGFFAAPLSH